MLNERVRAVTGPNISKLTETSEVERLLEVTCQHLSNILSELVGMWLVEDEFPPGRC